MPGNLLKNLEKSWKYHEILSVRKSRNPEPVIGYLKFLNASLLDPEVTFSCIVKMQVRKSQV